MASDPAQTFADVSLTLRSDPDDDVTELGTELRVKGALFAFLDGDRLAVDLPAARAHDLVQRGIASALGAPASASGTAVGTWVGIDDAENWLELASEAHQFVGEPPVGRQS